MNAVDGTDVFVGTSWGFAVWVEEDNNFRRVGDSPVTT